MTPPSGQARQRTPQAPWAQRLYRLALYAYPARFRRAFGDELWQTARDTLEAARADAQASGSPAHVAWVWLVLLADLARSAALERMTAMRRSIVIAPIMTGVAFVVSLLASLNLYLLEDQSPLAASAYRVSPLLRASYDLTYLSAMVAAVAICAVALYALLPSGTAPLIALIALVAIALIVAFGSLGGLLVRAPQSFLTLFALYLALLLLCLLAGWRVAARMRQRSGARAAAVVGACAGVGVALLVNAASLVSHTLALNPVSHSLYMQGEIPGTRYNSLLILLALQLLAILLCTVVMFVPPLPLRRGPESGAASL